MINLRFKEERERLTYTQPQIGALAGSSKNTVLNWERGSSTPNAAQLAKLERIGMDTHYVITGERKALPESIGSDEQVLLDAYRSLNPSKRREMLSILLSGNFSATPATKVINEGTLKGTQINEGNNTITINGDYHE